MALIGVKRLEELLKKVWVEQSSNFGSFTEEDINKLFTKINNDGLIKMKSTYK